MANLILTNNSSQVETTISQHYCRLTGNFAGPLTANAAANSGFLIQNGNKQSGLFVGNTCVTFYNNCLNFDPANTDVNLNIPNTRNFIITGNNSLLTFNADGTLAVGAAIDTNYKGMQVVNTNPTFILRDTDAVNQSGTQALSFFDSNSILSTSLCNEPTSTINTGLSITDNATNIVYNKYFRLRNNATNGGGRTLIASNNNLTLFSGDCLNRSFNFAVGGTSYFSSNICSSGTINSAGLTVNSVNSYLDGSGDSVGQSIIQRKAEASQFINFLNTGGQQHTSIISSQGLNGASFIQFYTTPAGAYASDRRIEAMRIFSDKKVSMYGDVCAITGCFTMLCSNGFVNNSARSHFSFDGANNHWFKSMKADGSILSEPASLGYGFTAVNGHTYDHKWYTSGRAAMILDFNQNLSVTGAVYSSGIISIAALTVNNAFATDSCIRSRCIIFCANGATQNIINCGNFINYGSRAIFSGICSTGRQDNFISGCLCVQDNVYTNCVCLTAGGGVCGPCGCFTTCVQSQVVCSVSCVRSDSISSIGTTNLNWFGNSVCVTGFVAAQNTTKAWGHFELIDGVASNCTGYNFNSLIICQNTSATPGTINFIYGLKLNAGVRYPFSLQMSVMPKGTFAWNPTLAVGSTQAAFSAYGAGTAGTIASNVATFIVPICSGVTVGGVAQAYVANSVYCDLYFSILNSKYFASTFAEMCRNFHDANIMFSINSF
jgi:hypothetical protein